MSTITTDMQDAINGVTADFAEQINDYHTIARFLGHNMDLFVSLSFEVMSQKLDGSYNNIPYVAVENYYGTEVQIQVHGPNQRETMRTVRRAIGGKWEKSESYGNRFKLTRDWNGIKLTLEGKRDEVCQRVVVGTTTHTVPAVEARPETTVTEEKVEWVCGNLLD